ncbi:actin binding Rho activating protein b [Gouania willdenowi]|uniref:actin binding Rho activating protein b n=1 Tax=Gouania willdenowi TaxID=441366 RepID=UPI001055BA17|nr:actin-binding Rho-activating protein [Gouania willdenowi]
MSDKSSTPKKPSTNKNIKKLRAISMVCSLTSSWQQWVKDNETKQSSEPSGWCPSSLGGTDEKPKKTWTPKKLPMTQTQPSEASSAPKISPTLQHAPKTKEAKDSDELQGLSPIKTKQVMKTVKSAVQEKSAGIELLAEKIQKKSLPSNEEIDKILKKKNSPTRRRKCSNVVSSLTKSWKQVENEHKAEGRPCGDGEASVQSEDSSGQTQRTKLFRETEENQSEEESEVTVRIKRPAVPAYKKEVEDASKINALSKKYSAVGNLKSRWQDWASEHTDTQKLNPFSEYFDYDYSMSLRLQKGQDGYGRPREGTKTAERARRAEQHIHREIDDMCYVIRTMADKDPDGKTRITFGELFERYVRISDKVVGILMRARKHGKVWFEGEMLWQGQDDGVIITLLV